MSYIVVLVTAPGEDEAEKIAKAVVEEALAACANIVREIRSIYRWQGKVEDEREALIVMKTKETLFDALAERVKELHSYAVPEIIALPVVKGSDGYLRWLEEETCGQVQPDS